MKLQVSFLLVSTLLATATAVRIPYSYNPEAKPQGWPFHERGWQQAYMEAYLSDLERANLAGSGGEVETMQQEAILQEEYSVPQYIGVETLTVGQTILVSYLSPDKGRVTVNLLSGNNDHVLHVDARYNWYGWEKVLVLNSANGSAWQQEEYPSEFSFPSEPSTTIVLRIAVKEDFFEIGAIGMPGTYKYKYRVGLLPDIVKKIEYRFGDTGAEKKAKLFIMVVFF